MGETGRGKEVGVCNEDMGGKANRTKECTGEKGKKNLKKTKMVISFVWDLSAGQGGGSLLK